MKHLKLFEQFDDEDPWQEDFDPYADLHLKNYVICNLDEEIESCIKMYPTLFDKKYGRMKVLYQMFFIVGSGYDWNDHGQLVDELDTELDTYKYKIRNWEREKEERTKEIEQYKKFISELRDLSGDTSTFDDRLREVEKYDKDPNFVLFPQEEKPLKFKQGNKRGDLNSACHYSKRFSPIFNIPDNVDKEYLYGAIEILEYVINNIVDQAQIDELTELRKNIKERFSV